MVDTDVMRQFSNYRSDEEYEIMQTAANEIDDLRKRVALQNALANSAVIAHDEIESLRATCAKMRTIIDADHKYIKEYAATTVALRAQVTEARKCAIALNRYRAYADCKYGPIDVMQDAMASSGIVRSWPVEPKVPT